MQFQVHDTNPLAIKLDGMCSLAPKCLAFVIHDGKYVSFL